MQNAALSSTDLGLLTECCRVAEENYVFYEITYKTLRDAQDKAIIGRVMGGKKAFIDAIDVLMTSSENTAKLLNHSERHAQGIPSKKNDPNHHDIQRFWSMINEHEARFEKTLQITINKIEDEKTRDLLLHHLMAAKIAVDAMSEASIHLDFS